MLSNTTKSVQCEIRDGFISAPKGCYIQLEKKAQKYILDNIRASFGARAGLVSRISTFTEDSGLTLNLANFAEYYHPDIRTIYARDSFFRLCVYAGVKDDFNEALEETMTKAFSRFATVDSRRFIRFLLDVLQNERTYFTESGKRMLQMLQFTIWQKPFEDCGFERITDGIKAIKMNPTMCCELIKLLQYNYNHIDFIDEPVDLGFDCPLDLHCMYTRDQLLVAMDFLKP